MMFLRLTLLLISAAILSGQAITSRAAPATWRQTAVAPSQSDMARRAAEARESGRFDEAIKLYRRTLDERPSWAEGWWYLGTLLFDKGLYQEARDCFLKITEINTNARGDVWAMLGICAYNLRDYVPSALDFEKARRTGVENARLRSITSYLAATLLTRLEEYGAAWEILKEFAAEEEKGPEVQEAFGLNLLLMPLLPSEIPPEKREMVMMAGRAAYEWAARRPRSAEEAFALLLARYDNAPNVHYAYGNFLLPDDPDRGLKELARELEISPAHWPALVLTANEYLRRGEHAQSLRYAEKAAGIAPGYFTVRHTLGRVLLGKGEAARAILELEAARRLSPESPEVYYTLARAYAQLGRRTDAARARATFLELDKKARTERSGPQSVGGAKAVPDPQ